jgi:hypothetical protein
VFIINISRSNINIKLGARKGAGRYFGAGPLGAGLRQRKNHEGAQRRTKGEEDWGQSLGQGHGETPGDRAWGRGEKMMADTVALFGSAESRFLSGPFLPLRAFRAFVVFIFLRMVFVLRICGPNLVPKGRL